LPLDEPTTTGGEIVEAVIFVGLQGAGKSSFYRERFFHTHLRINLDQLRTRHRERRILQVCVESRLRFVVDNTNPTRADRAVYIRAAKEAGFRVVGYYFQSRVKDCMRRNEQRPVPQRVPYQGLVATAGRMELPSIGEGFDELHHVRIDEICGFVVEGWRDEDR
jgi:predicted kinase